MGDIYFIIIPVVAVVVVLKVCLICCRIWFYQKRRQERIQCIQQRRIEAAHCQNATARVIAVRRVQGPGGIAQQTSYAINQPGCPTRQVTRTIIVRPATGRPDDPNLPPSYDQAITGADHSVKVDGGRKAFVSPQLHPPPLSGATPLPPSTPASNPSLPHMPPPHSCDPLPPPYAPPTTPTPSAPSPDIDVTDRHRLLP